ncbi:MAG: diguanylate cyclase domain-containing protein [Tepidiformaceae bacterium]
MATDPVATAPGARVLPWRKLMLLPWAVVAVAMVAVAISERGPTHIALPLLLGLAFVATQQQRRLSERTRRMGLRDLQMRLDNASYLNEFQSLPNRNYMLDQLRREMPRARHAGVPFVVVVVRVADLEGIAERRGREFADRVEVSLARLIERFTRVSDFAAELGEGTFGILLYECNLRMARSYLRRVPGVLAVSNGKHMLEIPLDVRVTEYDLESVYAIDVLREAEEAAAARAPDPLRFGAETA